MCANVSICNSPPSRLVAKSKHVIQHEGRTCFQSQECKDRRYFSLRSVNQDGAKVQLLEAIDESSVLIVQHWAKKYLPRKYKKSQTDWFGKRGIPWQEQDKNIHADVFAARDHLDVKIAGDIDLGLFFSSISSFTSCLFSSEIFNTKLNRSLKDALYARHGFGSRKNIAQARERRHLENAVAI